MIIYYKYSQKEDNHKLSVSDIHFQIFWLYCDLMAE